MEKEANATALISQRWCRRKLVWVFVVRESATVSQHARAQQVRREFIYVFIFASGLQLYHIRRLQGIDFRSEASEIHHCSFSSFHCRHFFIHPIQVHSFDEAQLSDLPRNLILSQEWRMNARPIPTLPTLRKPVTYQPTVVPPPSMFNQQEKRKSLEKIGRASCRERVCSTV